jgi:hypothetical protein
LINFLDEKFDQYLESWANLDTISDDILTSMESTINQSYSEAKIENINAAAETRTTKSFLETIEENASSSSLKRQGSPENSFEIDSENVTSSFVYIHRCQSRARKCKKAKIEAVKLYHVDPVIEAPLPFDIEEAFRALKITFVNRLIWPQNAKGR